MQDNGKHREETLFTVITEMLSMNLEKWVNLFNQF